MEELNFYIFNDQNRTTNYYADIKEAIENYKKEVASFDSTNRNKLIALGIDAMDENGKMYCFDYIHNHNTDMIWINDYLNHDNSELRNIRAKLEKAFNIKLTFCSNIHSSGYGICGVLIPFSKEYKPDTYCENKFLQLSNIRNGQLSSIKEVLYSVYDETEKSFQSKGYTDIKDFLKLNEADKSLVTMINTKYCMNDGHTGSMDIDVRDWNNMLEKSKQNYHIILSVGLPVDLGFKQLNPNHEFHIADCKEDKIKESVKNVKELYKGMFDYVSVVSPDCKKVLLTETIEKTIQRSGQPIVKQKPASTGKERSNATKGMTR